MFYVEVWKPSLVRVRESGYQGLQACPIPDCDMSMRFRCFLTIFWTWIGFERFLVETALKKQGNIMKYYTHIQFELW